jgi:hypothetical protein
MGGVFGYRDQKEFEAAIQRELDQMSTHGHSPGRRPGQDPPPARQRARSNRPPGDEARHAARPRGVRPPRPGPFSPCSRAILSCPGGQ